MREMSDQAVNWICVFVIVSIGLIAVTVGLINWSNKSLLDDLQTELATLKSQPQPDIERLMFGIRKTELDLVICERDLEGIVSGLGELTSECGDLPELIVVGE